MNQIELFEKLVRDYIGSRYAIAVDHGTSAIMDSLIAVGVGIGDKVITTPYTFDATSDAILHVGADPLFADIRREDYLINPDKVEELIKENKDEVKAILCVHLFGKVCNMNRLMELSIHWGIPLIEDASQSFGAEYKGKKAGTFGVAGTFSFYHTKNLPAYEGGMVVTDSIRVTDKIRALRNHGYNDLGLKIMLGYNHKMSHSNAFHGAQYLSLHKPAIKSMLGRYGPRDGYYPRVAYDNLVYRGLGIGETGLCPIAEEIAQIVRTKLRYIKQGPRCPTCSQFIEFGRCNCPYEKEEET